MRFEFEQQLKEVIQKNLPAAMGEELQTLIAEGKQAAEDLTRAQATISSQSRELEANRLEILNFRNRIRRAGELEAQEKALADRERALEVKLLEIRLEGATKTHDQFMKLMETVFRNPVVKESVTSSNSGGITRNGSWEGTSDSRTAMVEKTIT